MMLLAGFLPTSVWAILSCKALEKALFGAVAAISTHGELEGLEGDQAEGTVQGGLAGAMDSRLHHHP